MDTLAILSLIVLDAVAVILVALCATRIARLRIAGFIRGVIGGICGGLLEVGRVFAAVAIVGLFKNESTGNVILWLAQFRFQAIPFLVGIGFLIAMASGESGPSRDDSRRSKKARESTPADSDPQVAAARLARRLERAKARQGHPAATQAADHETGGDQVQHGNPAAEQAPPVPCPECGRPVLAATAQQTGGLCRPCWRRELSGG